MQQIKSAAAIINAIGRTDSLPENVRKVATIFGVVPGAVYNWRRDGVLPAYAFPICNRELFKLGLTAPFEMFTMRQDHANGRKPRRRRKNGR